MNGFTRILPIAVAIIATFLSMATAAAQTVDGQFPILVVDVSAPADPVASPPAIHQETPQAVTAPIAPVTTIIVYDRVCDPITGTCRLVPRRIATGVRNVVGGVADRCQCGCNRVGCNCNNNSQQVTVHVRRARVFRLRR